MTHCRTQLWTWFFSIDEIYEYADKNLKDRFSQITGVAKVDIIGGRDRQINIKVDQAKLMNHNLSIYNVITALKQENLDVPAGSIDRGMFELGVRLKGQFESIEEIENLYIYLTDNMSMPENMKDRASIQLKDVAEVYDGYEDVTSAARYNGSEAIMLSIYKQSDSNSVAVAQDTYELLEKVRPELPAGLNAETTNDTTEFIIESIKDARNSILIGILLTALVLYLFLGDIRMAFVAVVVIPTSIISAFIFMQALGFTLNVISLMALGVSIGALVANAIVIIENIHKHVEQSGDAKEGAVKGTSEVLVAVLASAGTNIVVFIPIGFMKGVIGEFFYPFGLTVVGATIFSLIASFSLTPMMSYLAFRTGELKKGIFDGLLNLVARTVEVLRAEYLRILDICLKHRIITVAVTLVAVFFSVSLMKYVGGEAFPVSDSSEVRIELELPQGASIEASELVVSRVQEIVAKVPEVKEYSSAIGGENVGVNEIAFKVKLVPVEERKRGDKEIADSFIKDLCLIPDVDFSVAAGYGGGQDGDMTVEIYGPDYAELVKLSEEVRTIMYDTGNYTSIRSSYKAPRAEVRFIPNDFTKRISSGDNATIGGFMRACIEGDDAAVYREAGEEYDINVALADRYINSPSLLGSIMVPLDKDGLLTPLSQLGNFEPSFAESTINRKDKERVINLTCFVGRLTIGENRAILAEKLKDLNIAPGYRVGFGGDVEIQDEAMASTSEAFLIATILTVMLLAAILNSFVHPVTIFLTIPLGAAGVFLALFFSSVTMNMMAMMALVMLVGIVVNSAILIVDQALGECRNGADPLAAVRQACDDKFRPILMTNIAIVFSLIPQAIGGESAMERVSIALPTIGGVLVATLFTMFFIPVVFYYMEKLRTLPARIRSRRSAA